MDDAQHLILSLQNSYDITLDWAGTDYCGVKLQWHYKHGYADMSMPGYVTKGLRK
jgi:endonuclease I